ncbi:AAA family ATPase [Mycolicibacterium brisbanense]|uniref:ATPase associated with various cellular activiti es, AAA_5 n=1 Tax=Mycolicibacterium brisbanense TaxID=146020 RepID=A0A100W6H1_9MYCO|nr:AAA family ATPase [Mycolicibacterium brisbanense]MCV7157831.1 AAA family ATPase [Mycolicibacterium brisbanense]GAS92476.1 ATPase associated with various cellular activiti es, AAA_5 [Mycolicibacterium brisbanense]
MTAEPSQLESWPAFARPTLVVLSDGQTWRTAELFEAVADEMQLTDAQRAETLSSGQLRARNRVGWALSALTRAQAVTKVRNGYSTITDFGRRLLEEHPVNITEEALEAIPEYQNYQPKARRPTAAEAEEGPPLWFVGAYYGDNDGGDQTESFIQQGIWRNGYSDRYFDEVNSMQPNERIAIKAAYTRSRRDDLDFDNKGQRVSVMAIKATGTITRNHGDGRTVDVAWDPQERPREWYFYTNRRTVWKVLRGDWQTDGLIDFTFDGVDQDIDVFRNSPHWRERFGDDATPATPDDDHADSTEEENPSESEIYAVDNIISEGCFIPRDALDEYLNALTSKKNLILQGPPGTGKTWLAKRLGYALIGEKNRNYLRIIQFHPSTSYEDFVRGWRPSADGKLVLADGVFLDIVESAQADPGHNYVLVIEEINRGNLAQIFGELLTLLESEKRVPSEAIDLTYRRDGEGPLHVPENLYIIGTMNLADRSLAIVDFALRRRFAFADLEPMFNNTWQHWVSIHSGIPTDELASIAVRIGEINASITADRSLGEQYRIGHSFFTPPTTRKITNTRDWLRQIVQREIRPLLAEYWFDAPDRVDRETARLLGEST